MTMWLKAGIVTVSLRIGFSRFHAVVVVVVVVLLLSGDGEAVPKSPGPQPTTWKVWPSLEEKGADVSIYYIYA